MNEYSKNPLDWVDEDATYQQFGYYAKDLTPRSGKPIVTVCQICGKTRISTKHDLRARCPSCAGVPDTSSLVALNKHRQIPNYVDVQETIATFGYDPRQLSKGSCHYVVATCSRCGKERRIAMQCAETNPNCQPCSRRTDEARKLQSERSKVAYVRYGHPMKGRNLSEQTRKNMMGSRPSVQGKNNPSYGKPPTHPKRRLYSRQDENPLWMRSSYEIVMAEYLDFSGITWEYEARAFPVNYILDGKQKQGTYSPDFYLPEIDRYIEVKGWWRKIAKAKFAAFREQYPYIEIEVWMEKELQLVGAL